MGIKIGMCGVGEFAKEFIPLFKAHPEVEKVILCDLDAEKLKSACDEFGIPDSSPSLDDLCKSDVDAIAIITQHHLHGPQAVQAMKAGKHVYSAVPSAITIEEMAELVKTVKETGQIYMVGETSYYYPCAIYCRERFRNGDFGHIVYGEGEYIHDYSHGLYDVYKWRYGKDWKKYFGIPPMFYPTHSTSMIVSVTGAHVTHVCGMGVVDHHEDGLHLSKDNFWKNPFSNETMLCKMSDGSIARINEFRRIGHPGACGMSLYGTAGSYEEQVGATGEHTNKKTSVWVTADIKERKCLDDLLRCESIPGASKGGMALVTSDDGTHSGISGIHDTSRLPREFTGMPNGHSGSHHFLVDDFVKACVSGKTPPNNVWEAARYLIPGLIAHESAMNGSVLMEVPDFGDPPEN